MRYSDKNQKSGARGKPALWQTGVRGLSSEDKMSRNYAVEVEAKGISLEHLRHVMTKRFGWVELDAWEHKGITHFEGEGCLCGGESEEQAHQAIAKALKEAFPGARVMTRWTNLDERPYTVYGDALE